MIKPSEKAEFDSFEADYEELIDQSIRFSSLDHSIVTKIKADLVIEATRRHFDTIEDLTVLDIGCGIGVTGQYLTHLPWRLYGIDISSKSIQAARRRNPGVTYLVSKDLEFPFDDASADVCFCICVIHHIPVESRIAFLEEIKRVTRSGGLIIVFEHNPYHPLTRYAVKRCALDRNALLLSKRHLQTLFDAAKIETKDGGYFLFSPFHGRLAEWVENKLSPLCFGAKYHLIGTPSKNQNG